jgi:predicted component of type VI protein secretion system
VWLQYLSDNADAVAEHVTAIEQLLADRRGRPKTAEQLATEMRKSDGFRGQVSKALDNIARQISRSSVATASPVRGRMISRKSQDG